MKRIESLDLPSNTSNSIIIVSSLMSLYNKFTDEFVKVTCQLPTSLRVKSKKISFEFYVRY